MKVVPPLVIDDARLVSTTAAEPGAGETAWVTGTTYAIGDVRIRTETHRKYERVIAGAGATAPESDPINWKDVGPTNAWAMFDLERSTATEVASALTVVVEPGKRIDSLGLVGLLADQVVITMTVGVDVIYTVTHNLRLRRTTRWSEYYFGEFRWAPSFAVFNLPLAGSATITVALTRSSGSVRCGGLVLGRSVYLGDIVDDPSADADNFSKITRDDFGNATLVKRRMVPKTEQKILAPRTIVDKLREVRADLDATPALWSGLDDRVAHDYFESFLILGIHRRFTINANQSPWASVALQLEEI